MSTTKLITIDGVQVYVEVEELALPRLCCTTQSRLSFP
jgi:hypothetical protein